ncbi:MAG: right-handed parallel beta-helix repeat-containing protein, partial [Halobaculum sp.]
TQNDDGTWTAVGSTGGGDGDTYRITGDVLDFSPMEGDYALTWDGADTTSYDLTGTEPAGTELVITSPSVIDYEFTATGSVEKVFDAGHLSAEQSNDSVTQNSDGTYTVTGSTGGGDGDTYRIDGDVTAFSPMTGDYSLTWGGTDTTAAELTGAGTSGSSGSDTAEFVITSPTVINYSFTADGKIEKVFDAGHLSAEQSNDSVTQNDDGTWTAVGSTGGGDGDTYRITGDVLDFSPMEGDYALTWNGTDTTAYDLTGAQPPSGTELVITSPSVIDYEFTADGEIQKVFDNGNLSAEQGNDAVVDNGDGTWTATGSTGGGDGDSYDVLGDVTDFSPLTGDYALTWDGAETTASELTGQTTSSGSTSTSSPSSTLIGGGDGYPDTVPPSAATYTVSTKSELESALSSAGSGDVVYVAGDAEIDMGSTELVVPAGVTFASDRGINGAPGGRIYTQVESWPMFLLHHDVRVTGLRVSGPHDTYTAHASNVGMGLRAYGDGIEIDNNEVYGFSHAAIRAISDTHVHHNDIHHNPMDGIGYGVSCTTGHPLIEYNYLNYNRHGVASSGAGGYTVRYNHFGPDTIDHVIDCHNGGKTLKIHHNTVEAVTQVQNNSTPENVAIRYVPDDVADIHNNWLYNPNQPKSAPEGWDGSSITQVHVSSWTNVTFDNNHYGSSDPGNSDIGAPR